MNVLGAALAVVIGAAPLSAAPPSPPAPKPICELPFWRQPLAHTGQEELFMVWMDFEFGPVWLEVLPDEMIQILWEYFSFDGYAAAD